MILTALRRSLLLVSLGSAVLVPSLLTAADTPPPPPYHGAGPHEGSFNPEKRLARLTGELNLTADQQAKLRPIFTAQAEELKKLDETPLTGAQRREMMRALRQTHRDKIHAVLTPEQRTQMRETFREKRQERRERRDERSDTPPPSVPQS